MRGESDVSPGDAGELAPKESAASITLKQNLEDSYNKNFFMSGSGSALFSLFEEHEEIEEIVSKEFSLKYFSITKKIDCSLSQNDD